MDLSCPFASRLNLVSVSSELDTLGVFLEGGDDMSSSWVSFIEHVAVSIREIHQKHGLGHNKGPGYAFKNREKSSLVLVQVLPIGRPTTQGINRLIHSARCIVGSISKNQPNGAVVISAVTLRTAAMETDTFMCQ